MIIFVQIISVQIIWKERTVWTTEHSIETTVSPEAIWRAWAAVDRWPEWNSDIERISLAGPFAQGATIAMTPRGQETVELRIAEAVEGELFVDEADVGGTVVRTTHRIDRVGDDRFRVVYRLEADGPAAEQLGPAVSADFPETIDALVEHAAK
jgi:Polyketide cyclase / dehydrase and lipid transport